MGHDAAGPFLIHGMRGLLQMNEECRKNVNTFTTGAVRGTDADSTRYDLISPVAMRRIAETYAEGATKYGAHNWRKGFPASDLMNHALKHLYTFLAGDRSEDHLAHATWNLMAIMHFQEKMPGMIDIPCEAPMLPVEKQ